MKMPTIGNYRIESRLAEGGFARIYVARHVMLDELACLKQNIRTTPDDVELLRREAKVMWELYEYHSIPAVRDYIRLDDRNAMIVLSYIEGRTLDEIVKSGRGRIHPEDASWITERLLGALYYAHSNGVIHSDIKPQNVLVEPKKRDIKLIDWGLAVLNPTSRSKVVGYTPAYVAPEVLDGKPPIPETDLYGAGLVMLTALGGDVAKKSLPSDVPDELAEFCSSLLRYNPVDRPNWDKDNPLQRLSDIREKVFERRHAV